MLWLSWRRGSAAAATDRVSLRTADFAVCQLQAGAATQLHDGDCSLGRRL